jgi:hypothetical protein
MSTHAPQLTRKLSSDIDRKGFTTAFKNTVNLSAINTDLSQRSYNTFRDSFCTEFKCSQSDVAEIAPYIGVIFSYDHKTVSSNAGDFVTIYFVTECKDSCNVAQDFTMPRNFHLYAKYAKFHISLHNKQHSGRTNTELCGQYHIQFDTDNLPTHLPIQKHRLYCIASETYNTRNSGRIIKLSDDGSIHNNQENVSILIKFAIYLFEQILNHHFGNVIRTKYLKYKQKYLELKKLLNK